MIDSKPFKKALLKLAAYYDKVLTDQQLAVYGDQLSRFLTEAECNQAITLYVDDPKNEFFPRPVSKLVELIKKPVATEDISQNVTSLLIQAVKKFGDYWSDGYMQNGIMVFEGKDKKSHAVWEDAARTVVGDLGLQIIRRAGGWKHFCASYYEQPEGVLRGQTAKLGTAMINIHEKTGDFDCVQIAHDPRLQNLLSSIKTKDEPDGDKPA